MPHDFDVSAARDLALQKIGRNVVNVQKMEAMLTVVLAGNRPVGSDPSPAGLRLRRSGPVTFDR